LSQKPLVDARVWLLLYAFDCDLIDKLVAKGCRCGGRLDRSDYRRKVNVPKDVSEPDFALRFSACCANEGCRKRATSASVRFLGRKRFLGVIVVLVSAMRQGATPRRARVLQEEFGVTRRTIERWRRWWDEEFRASRCWKLAKAKLLGIADEVPRSVLIHLDALEGGDHLVAVMRLFAPISQSEHLPDLVW
jgi:hypothetical protein